MRAGASIIVSGLVQGVGFRYFVQRIAAGMDLNGYVQNLYTGEVLIVAEGDRSLVEELVSQVRIGPRSAHVSDLKIQWIEPANQYHGFEIR